MAFRTNVSSTLKPVELKFNELKAMLAEALLR